MGNIGIFGGSFDPVHNAHIETATVALQEFNLKSVIFVPAYLPPHKASLHVSEIHRVNMLKLAIKNNSNFLIDLYEINSKKIIYTYQTLDYIQNKTNDKLVLIIGSDSFEQLHTWKNTDYIAKNYGFISIQRGNIKFDTNNKYYPFCKISNKIIENISATKIRQMLEQNNPNVEKLISKDVFCYIKEHNLYGKRNI